MAAATRQVSEAMMATITGPARRASSITPEGGTRPREPLGEPARSTYNFLYRTWRCAVKTMTYSQSRARYAETLDAVVNDREEVVITRAGHDPVVIVSLADYESLKETAYLLQNPVNARRLLNSIERLESGQGVERELVE